jgi:hypothetical protein
VQMLHLDFETILRLYCFLLIHLITLISLLDAVAIKVHLPIVFYGCDVTVHRLDNENPVIDLGFSSFVQYGGTLKWSAGSTSVTYRASVTLSV